MLMLNTQVMMVIGDVKSSTDETKLKFGGFCIATNTMYYHECIKCYD